MICRTNCFNIKHPGNIAWTYYSKKDINCLETMQTLKKSNAFFSKSILCPYTFIIWFFAELQRRKEYLQNWNCVYMCPWIQTWIQINIDQKWKSKMFFFSVNFKKFVLLAKFYYSVRKDSHHNVWFFWIKNCPKNFFWLLSSNKNKLKK